jgi:drug/metabolite transporter (DMT)-like permease
MTHGPSTTALRAYLLLTLGVFCCSLSVIFIKNSDAHPLWLSAIRLLIAAIALAPLTIRSFATGTLGGGLSTAARTLPGAVLLAVHFILWTAGARMTEAANGSLIVNLTTVVMPVVMWLLYRERLVRGEVIGTVIALSGVVALVGGHYQLSRESFTGDVVCFVAMVLFCFYLALSRRGTAGRSLWMYVVPLYFFAGLMCMAAAVMTRAPLPPATMKEAAMLLSLGLVPTVLGHSIINASMGRMRGQSVAIVNLSQFAFAGLAAYLVSGERPSVWFYPVCLLIVIGAVVTIRAAHARVEIDSES